jgi:hypothetical protein
LFGWLAWFAYSHLFLELVSSPSFEAFSRTCGELRHNAIAMLRLLEEELLQAWVATRRRNSQ